MELGLSSFKNLSELVSKTAIIEMTSSVRCQWLTPVILATQEAEIRRMEVRSQPWANSSRDPIKKTHHKKGLVEWLKV
jgi:uncharacterized protein (DUF305 family)